MSKPSGSHEARAWALATIVWLAAAIVAEPLSADVTDTLGAALPQGINVVAADPLEFGSAAHLTCTSCITVTVHNPGPNASAVTVSVTPLPEPAAQDRSIGEWVYRYVREHTGLDGDITLAEPDVQQAVTAIGSRTRFRLRAASFSGPAVDYTSGSLKAVLPLASGTTRKLTLYDGPTLASSVANSPIEDFLYWSLWSPLRWLCLQVEGAIAALLPILGAFGVTLLIVLVVRAITFPINRWSFRSQQAFEAVQRDIAPELADIKSRLKGADQSEAILKLYQARNMNPLSGLKGSVGLFVQIPILIAMFNVASDSAILSGVPMGWVPDIALPEHTAAWGMDVPMLGKFFNLIALGLAGFMLWGELSKPERSPGALAFAVAVGVLLYSFPAFLVVYWFLITIAQKVEQTLATRSASVEQKADV